MISNSKNIFLKYLGILKKTGQNFSILKLFGVYAILIMGILIFWSSFFYNRLEWKFLLPLNPPPAKKMKNESRCLDAPLTAKKILGSKLNLKWVLRSHIETFTISSFYSNPKEPKFRFNFRIASKTIPPPLQNRKRLNLLRGVSFLKRIN